MRRQVVDTYKDSVGASYLSKWLSLPRSTLYYRATDGPRGRKPSNLTLKTDGTYEANQEVVNTLIREVYGKEEFNQYGYILSTQELKERGYIINHKKVYRLMQESGLLLEKVKNKAAGRQWVKWRTIKGAKPLDYICMDIKYIYVHGEKRNAYLLAIMDVCTRTVLAWSLRYNMKHTHVVLCLDGVLQAYPAIEVMLRTDNGSQFIAHGLKKYLQNKPVKHEFTHVATPEENAYVESLFSNVERELIRKYEFEGIYDAKDVFARYFEWYNTKRKHHGIGRKSPLNYWNISWGCHPVRPPEALQNLVVQGFFEKYYPRDEGGDFSKNPKGLVLQQ